MSRVSQRLKGIFRRNPRTPQPSYNPDSYNEKKPYLPTNPPYQPNEILNGINDDVVSVTSDNSLQQTTLQGQTRERTPLDEVPSSTSINRPNSQLRTTSNSIQPYLSSNNNINTNLNSTINPDTAFISNSSARAGLPTNNITNTNINPTVNTDTASISNPSARAGLSTEDPSSHPPTNPISQTPLLPINQVPQSSLRNHFPTIIDRNQRPFKISPNSTLVGFPLSQNRQTSWLSRSSFTTQQNQPPFPARLSSSRPQNHISNIEIDYPIENVLIDGNIPSSIAIKINEAVEHDRFGNAYLTQHYAYEPQTQHIAIGHNQHIQRRFIGNSHQTGMRYIREINNEKFYPQKLIINDRPLVNYDWQYDLNSFPAPIYHFTACASPNDPMRCY